jgi:hypothetical protein
VVLVNQGKGEDFRLGENGVLMFRDRVCVLIHLVNLFDDSYFDNNDEVRIVYVYTYDVVISLLMMITCL